MEINWLNQLGDWNPQLFRELKGRLRPRNVAIAVIISLVGQILTLICFYTQLPLDPFPDLEFASRNRYFIGGGKPFLESINFALWWLDIFRLFSWILPVILLVGSVYMLINDLTQEEQRGTLNFIRLSPQSSQNILMGKILGVPILLYLALGVAVPLHWIAAIGAGISLGIVFCFYLLFGAVCLLFNSAALLYALLGGGQPGVGSILSLVLGIPCIQVINYYLYAITEKNFDWTWVLQNKLQWFYLPIGSNLAIAYSFTMGSCALGIYWIWQALNRRFCNPSSTLISKKQSYWINACFTGLMLGFFLPILQFNLGGEELLGCLGFIATLNLIWFLVLIAALLPQRQALQDWARYQHKQRTPNKGLWSHSLLQELVWGEKSPALVAIALNIAIAALIWIPWILLWSVNTYKTQAIFGLLLSLSLILIYSAIAELLRFMKTPKRNLWAGGILSTTMFLPPLVSAVLSSGDPQGITATILLFSPFLWIGLDHVAGTTTFFVLLAQWSVFAVLSLQLTRQLKKAGESASKELLSRHVLQASRR